MKEELLYRYLYGQTTEEENKQILDWLDADPAKRTAKLNELHYVCAAADHYLPQFLAVSNRKRIRPHLFRKIACYAASIAASVLLLSGVWYWSNQSIYNKIANRTVILEAPEGQHFNIILEDGTKVWLNGGSTLKYPPVFSEKQRNVELAGEAMFEVQHHAKRPFKVKTFASEIEVKGTKFNVIAEKEHHLFSVTLVEGEVKITNLQNPAEVFFMQPHDVVSLNGRHLYKTYTSDFADLCWTEGLIHIKEMPFERLMMKLEKAYGVKIVIHRTELPKVNVISGEIRVSNGIDHALHVLQRLADFTYTRNEEDNVIEIR